MRPLLIEITPRHWAAGRNHLAGANRAKLEAFGDQELGFAAESAVAEWLTAQGIEFEHNEDPTYTGPDFIIGGESVDLKSVSTKGPPRADYDANLATKQINKGVDWYLFGKYDNTTPGDYYILGFQTERAILKAGVRYRKGEMTRKNMKAPCDCICISYHQLLSPAEWLSSTVFDFGEEF